MANDKELGNLSVDELESFVSIFKEVDDFMFEGDSLREMDLDVPSWGRMYELSFGELAGLAMIGLGVFDQFLSAIDSENPQGSVLEFAQETESPFDNPGDVEPYAKAALLATLFNMRSVSRFQVSVSDLVTLAAKGDIDAMLRALRIDPLSIQAEPIAAIFSQAKLRHDHSLLDNIGKAMKGSSPRLPSEHLAQPRVATRILQDAGAMAGLTVEELRHLLVDRLSLYPPNGDSHSAIRDIWRENKRTRGA